MNILAKSDAVCLVPGASPRPPLMPLDALRLFVLAILALKVAFAFGAPPNADEAYYFIWGQHLQLSYRDHPPMVGWGEAAGAALFGWNYLGLRFATFVTAGATVGLFRLWARRLAPGDPSAYFWLMLGAYFASPLFLFTSTNVYPDHFLLFFLLAASYFLTGFLGAWREGGQNSYGKLYLAALFMGLAGLSKYNAVFFPLALVGVLASDRRWRGLFRAPQLYLAGAIALLVVSPVFIWNAQHGFISFQWQFGGRFDGARRSVSGFNPWGFVQEGGAILYFGPFLMPALYRFLRAGPEQGEIGAIIALGKWSFYLSCGFMLALALWAPASHLVKPYWSDVAFVPFVVVAPLFCVSPRLFKAHVLAGAAVFAVMVALYLLNPLPTHLIGLKPLDQDRFGRPTIAAEVLRAKAKMHADFVVTPNYIQTSLLAFGAGTDKDFTSVDPEKDQFALWRGRRTLEGKTAILVLRGDVAAGSDGTPPCKQVTKYKVVTAKRFGLPIETETLFFLRFKDAPR